MKIDELAKLGFRYGTGTYYSVRIGEDYTPLTDDIISAIQMQNVLVKLGIDMRENGVCHLGVNPDLNDPYHPNNAKCLQAQLNKKCKCYTKWNYSVNKRVDARLFCQLCTFCNF